MARRRHCTATTYAEATAMCREAGGASLVARRADDLPEEERAAQEVAKLAGERRVVRA